MPYADVERELSGLLGELRPATEYFTENVLSAVEMTSVNYAADLYAQLHIVLYESAGGGSTIEYHKPPSKLRRFDDTKNGAVGRTLDRRLVEALAGWKCSRQLCDLIRIENAARAHNAGVAVGWSPYVLILDRRQQ